MNREKDKTEYEKMIIDIPKNALAVIATTLASKNGRVLMDSHQYDTQDIQKRKIEEEKMKKYKLWITKYNILKRDYEVIEEIITTNDIYHEIGYIYCTTLEDIKRIDYQEVRDIVKDE